MHNVQNDEIYYRLIQITEVILAPHKMHDGRASNKMRYPLRFKNL